MAEKDMRGRVVKWLRPLDAVSVENRVGYGHPDVNYIGGDVELKWLPRWPRNCDSSPVKIDHFTPQQRVWLKRRWRRGGSVYLLLQVRMEWLLFDGMTAAHIVGRVSRVELVERAHRHWAQGMEPKELVRCLSEPRTSLLPNASDWTGSGEERHKLRRPSA